MAPSATTMPDMLMRLMLIPLTDIAMKVKNTDSGIEIAIVRVACMLPRMKNITRMATITPMMPELMTASRDALIVLASSAMMLK